MPAVHVMILQPPAPEPDGPLVALLHEAWSQLARRHLRLFLEAGARSAERFVDRRTRGFGERVAARAAELRPGDGLVVLGAGAAVRLDLRDARRLVAAAGAGRAGRRPPLALTNNRHSSDVCAVPAARVLACLPPLGADNGLPRWLAERAGYRIAELPGRARLAFDLDTPLDLALLALGRGGPPELRRLADQSGIAVPRLAELRSAAADPRAELLVFGRASSGGLAFLERHLPCRVRFLSEERGLRSAGSAQRAPRATLGRLLALEGPESLAAIIAELADAAILDLRVLLADHRGPDEARWPVPEDRFAADLLQPEAIRDPWLRALTATAAAAGMPILLGGHTLVGPGLRLLFRGAARPRNGPG